VRQREHHVHVVLDDDLGDAPLADALQQVDGVVGVGPRHPRGGLVEQQQLGILHQAHGEFQAPLVAA
jgi:hypothetical protein